jgi:prepilin-type N-terminal cleavage/methylation domain-containing protein
MNRHDTLGFTLVEMAVTILVLGLLFAFSIPAYQNVSASYQLRGATENIAAQLRMAREKAIATGMDQPMHFTYGWTDPLDGVISDYHLHYPSGFVPAKWRLPKGITYFSVTVNPTMQRDGRINASGNVILRDTRGNRDTVSVQMSGLILTK